MKFKKSYLSLLVLLIFAGAILRLYDIEQRGIFWVDEAFFLNASKTIYAFFNFIFDKVTGNITVSFSDYLIANGGGYVTGAKLGYLFFEVLAFFIFGVNDYSGIMVSAISGIASILLLYSIGKKIFDAKTAIVATAIFTFSPYHIIYSRSALSVTLMIFFILLGILFYLKAQEVFTKEGRLITGYLFLAGIAIGYGYSCHYSLFWAILMMLLVELVFLICSVPHEAGIFLKVRRLFVLLAGISLPLLVWQLITVIGRFLIRKFSGSFELPTYFAQIVTYFLANGGANFSFQDADYYIRVLLKNDGMAIIAFFIVGSAMLVLKLKGKINYIILLSFSYVPLILYSLYKTNKTPHGIIGALPFIILIAAYGFVAVYGKLYRKNKTFATTYALFVVFFSIYTYFFALKAPLIAKSTYPEALEYINRQGDFGHFSSNPAASLFYERRHKVYPTERLTIDDAKELYKNKGYRYLILDWNLRITAGQNELISEILKSRFKPVFSAPYVYFDMLYFGDNETDRMIGEHSIEVYDLSTFFAERMR